MTILKNAIGEGSAEHPRARRGVVMVIVLSILLILGMMGVVFVTFQSLEKRVAINFTDDVRSKLLAQSGIEYGVAELERIHRDNAGLTYTTIGGLSVANWDTSSYYYGNQNDENLPPNPDWPLEQAVNPSFALEVDGDPSDGPDNPSARTLFIEGNPRGITGFETTGTYASNGDVYALKVSDESSKININDGVRWGRNHSVTKNLERVLNVLGTKISVSPAFPATGAGALGTLLMDNRPAWDPSLPKGAAQGYKSTIDLLGPLAGDWARYNAVNDFVTAYSWTDRNVVNPVPLSNADIGYYPASISYSRPTYPAGLPGPRAAGTKHYRHGHQRDYKWAPITSDMRFFDPALWGAQPFHNGIYGHDSLVPNWIEVVERSPVNVNMASFEVLTALLTDIQGFFTAIERRRDRPISTGAGGGYGWLDLVYTYDSTGKAEDVANNGQAPFPSTGGDGDECGFIYTTMKFKDNLSSVLTEGELRAQEIADEIIACRMRVSNCGVVHNDHGTLYNHVGSEVNYSTAGCHPFAGPFRTWAQFNAFVDYLVEKGIIYENRGGAANTWFFDYTQASGVFASASKLQQWMAAQAAADALKANFNPNLNLNELNPNRNLYTLVDKTDLIVNSTELSFVNNNGTYEIESLGMILQPDSGSDVFAAANNQIVANKKAVSVVKLMADAVRLTHMNDFRGDLPPSGSPNTYVTDNLFSPITAIAGEETNNNYSVEIGPEPENGALAEAAPAVPTPGDQHPQDMRRYRYSGYIQLPTYGGVYHTTTSKKPPWTSAGTARSSRTRPPCSPSPSPRARRRFRSPRPIAASRCTPTSRSTRSATTIWTGRTPRWSTAWAPPWARPSS